MFLPSFKSASLQLYIKLPYFLYSPIVYLIFIYVCYSFITSRIIDYLSCQVKVTAIGLFKLLGELKLVFFSKWVYRINIYKKKKVSAAIFFKSVVSAHSSNRRMNTEILQTYLYFINYKP